MSFYISCERNKISDSGTVNILKKGSINDMNYLWRKLKLTLATETMSRRETTQLLLYVKNKDADQPTHPRSLISAFGYSLSLWKYHDYTCCSQNALF